MRCEGIIEGQINIFDLPIVEIIETKKNINYVRSITKEDKFESIINLYATTCSRIVKTNSGALLVELDNKTLYFGSNGINEFELPKDVGIMPGEEVLVVNRDKELNSLQKQKLKELNPKEYIKRKGDANLIIPGEKTIVINPKGWILEYIQEPNYKEKEIFTFEVDFRITAVEELVIDVSEVNFNINDKVNIEYQGIKSIGKIVKIYNNGETLNVKWDGNATAFYYKNVTKAE